MVLNLRRTVGYDTQVDGKNPDHCPGSRPGGSATTAGPPSRISSKPRRLMGIPCAISISAAARPRGPLSWSIFPTARRYRHSRAGQNLVIDFFKTSLPDKLRPTAGRDRFRPRPIREHFSQGENVRMVISPKGVWEHSAYQTDPVRGRSEADRPTRTNSRRGARRIQRREVVAQLPERRSAQCAQRDRRLHDLNIITSDAVGGSLTLRLKDVPWDQALQIILDTARLDMRKNGNVVWIAPRDELATKEKLTLESQQQIGELEAVRTRASCSITRRRRKCRRCCLDTQKILSKRGSAVVDARTNTVFVQDVPARLDEVRSSSPDRRGGAPGDDRGAYRRGKRFLQQESRRAARLQPGASGRGFAREERAAHFDRPEPGEQCAADVERRGRHQAGDRHADIMVGART